MMMNGLYSQLIIAKLSVFLCYDITTLYGKLQGAIKWKKDV
jgi:hypothetical protein